MVSKVTKQITEKMLIFLFDSTIKNIIKLVYAALIFYALI